MFVAFTRPILQYFAQLQSGVRRAQRVERHVKGG
jgi:hypothetical protein